jgi:hypothetical protein
VQLQTGFEALDRRRYHYPGVVIAEMDLVLCGMTPVSILQIMNLSSLSRLRALEIRDYWNLTNYGLTNQA